MRPASVITYWRWGPEPRRVVLLAHTARPARIGHDAEPGAAEVWGADGRHRVLPQREEGVAATRRGVRLADGTEWTVNRPGCGCQVPAALRGFAPKVGP